jgi:pyridoxine kinase
MMPKAPVVLSIQSDVVRGHVGNGAARFALQRCGFDVWALPTVLLSNHPGHGKVRGETTSVAKLGELLNGLDDHGWLIQCAGILSGYLGSADQAEIVAEAVTRVKAQNQKAL